MDNIVVITQNLKLASLSAVKDRLCPGSVLIVSTQFVFENERDVIDNALGVKCEYVDFADLLTDEERQKCDEEAFNDSLRSAGQYYARIKTLKNERIVAHMEERYPCDNRLLLCDDLGIDGAVWEAKGYKPVRCEYYHVAESSRPAGMLGRLWQRITGQIGMVRRYYNGDIWQASFRDKKHLFFGSMNRIGYRIDLEFKKASKWENVKFILAHYSIKLFHFMPTNDTVRMTTFHEDSHWGLPDHKNFNVKKIQDGYLPPNYTSKYLRYYGRETEFYAWDEIGCHTFQYHHLKYVIMPFRKKLYLPEPRFPKKVKRVLCVASGAGDWTAIKNRSDEDMMLWAFGKVAAILPGVEFVYRCHPVWIHPQHQGVNSIKRAAKYYDWLKLPNLKLSGNIPDANQGGEFVLSYKRSSFDEDLKDVDLVFGEHSVSMLDAGFKHILFASCNVTGHRNLWEDITKLGFPHCESVEEIVELIKKVETPIFKSEYMRAVKNYNEMTDREL